MFEGRWPAIAQLITASREGDSTARDRLIDAIYEDIRTLAAKKLANELNPDQRRPSSLANEFALRLWKSELPDVDDQRHFVAILAGGMRQVLVDWARKRKAVKRGGGRLSVELHENVSAPADSAEITLAVDEALARLSSHAKNKELVQLIELRFFADLEMSDVAEQMNVSISTAERRWRRAREFLSAYLGEHELWSPRGLPRVSE